jgi:hypothetical protein
MKLLSVLKETISIVEEMGPGSEPYDYYRDGEYLVEWWTAPHVYELRDGKPRIPDMKIFDKIIDLSSPLILKKYFFEGKRFRDIRPETQIHPRFIIRRIKGKSRPQMVVQIEELNFEKKKIVLQILSFMDMDGTDFRVLDKGEKSLRFILDL